ncbi:MULTISPECIES: LLM class flavin-dependent oxidoreductase [Metabacillus]|uniref:LLM class flavin-dependent oxidoreductase n=1 Tax=Metabacillus hrfriensis TaxID=3048891 RepID=A0ACD4R5V2_9BACI|nr:MULTISPECIES: LLM class flavin-dependent oxidoreductase [Metabacillus]UAL50368.1 LLM class flavin-dependent oxidoreductase [Metabacillus dongyingensis]UOK56472.1 LLM class flavin-dependent oxidoreductase [Bacillus sp. OVS6]USK26622.1 LLM class flavin-dependent oxidoreductase [Bacillus sp. CMF21]WHZ55843.1 LLM class flavin-dependent oxidoreductase [Metabacillus sp. CT-WN-B3]
MKLSILDQSPISEGSSARNALKQTLQLAKAAEELGYTRFWVAEHHNTNGLASTAPEILISHIASNTSRIKVGSGGVLLPQYSPFKVAETFNTLEVLFPNRIDLGIGRSPGGGAETRLALTDGIRKSLNEFPRQLQDLQGFLSQSLPVDHAYSKVLAMPDSETSPEMWLLGVSHRGARTAAEHGLAFTYGHFINPASGRKAMKDYLEQFQPTQQLTSPKSNFCIFVVCAETEEKAEYLALSQDAWLLNVEKGGNTKIPSPEEVKKIDFSPDEQEKINRNRDRMIIGTPQKVKDELLRIGADYKTDECMVISNLFRFEDKLKSYELLAESFELKQR